MEEERGKEGGGKGRKKEREKGKQKRGGGRDIFRQALHDALKAFNKR